jgi:hypothetical protein
VTGEGGGGGGVLEVGEVAGGSGVHLLDVGGRGGADERDFADGAEGFPFALAD